MGDIISIKTCLFKDVSWIDYKIKIEK